LSPEKAEDHYPHLDPQVPLELIQVDIVLHFLPGGTSVACFNALDVVSHYPTGEQRLTKRYRCSPLSDPGLERAGIGEVHPD
jgi:hypothetical protein